MDRQTDGGGLAKDNSLQAETFGLERHLTIARQETTRQEE